MTTPEGKRAEPVKLKHRYDNRRLTDAERERASFTCQYKRDGFPIDGYFGLCEAWKKKITPKWEPCYRQGQQHFEFLCPRCMKFHKIKQRIRELA